MTQAKPRYYMVQRHNERTERFEDIGVPHRTLYAAQQFMAECELLHADGVFSIRPSFKTEAAQ